MRKFALVATLTLGMATTLMSNAAEAAAERAAIRAVEGYMGALIIGDTQSMGNRMGSNMQAERGKILQNPSYSKTLQKAYAGAKYTVVSSEQISEERAEVLVRITLASKDNVHVRFLLSGGPDYVIVSES